MTTLIHSIGPGERPAEITCRALRHEDNDTFRFCLRTGAGFDVTIFFNTEEQFLEFCEKNSLTYTDDRPAVENAESAA